MNKGNIKQIIGPVVDVYFEGEVLPAIKNALTGFTPEIEEKLTKLESKKKRK